MQSSGGTKILRTGDLHGDLGKYLFYWRARKDPEEISDEEDLKTAIEELKHHQMALLSGFRKSLADGTMTVLDHVSPDTIVSHVLGDKASGNASAGRTANPLRAARYWREFLRRFDDLVSEDAAWFQRQFLPSFREGYREYMFTKTQAQSTQHSPSTEGER
jgi:predicted component of type VI protein secretion system